SCTITAPTSNVQSLLIGSSQERKDLKEEIDDALRKSEAADWEKANKSKDEEVLKKLQQDRLSRVLPEPELIEEHTVISVRHKTLGTKRRLFPQNATFANVYDWVGSLSERPKFFCLHIPNQRTVQCWEKVESFGK
uniref:UBX domain-containing protein n=1 Tax=Clytia hemisphaerica TaxID=252671 RepID=A0A7M6DLE0_9CNID